jgi:hypothetical protein
MKVSLEDLVDLLRYHPHFDKMLNNKATSKKRRARMVGQTRSQNNTNQTLDRGVRIKKSASHLLHRTLFCRPALRNKTAKSPPANNTSQLNEPLNSTAGV